MSTTEPRTRFTLGDNIRRARMDAGIDQYELATKIGKSRQVISKWEADKSIPDFISMQAIVRVCDADWLLTEPFRISGGATSSIGWYVTAGEVPVAA